MNTFIQLLLQIVRFLIAGGASTVLYYSLYYPLTEWSHVHYLVASGIAFPPAFAANFLLQKLWAFKNVDMIAARRQLGLFTLKHVGLFATNGVGLFLLVELAHLWHLTAQVGITAVLTAISYLVNRWIFAR